MKAKKQQPTRLSTLSFLTIWLAAHGIGWGSVFAWYVLNGLMIPLPQALWFIVLGFVPGMTIAVMQRWLVQHNFGLVLHGWLPVSAIGWLLGGLSLNVSFTGGIDQSIALAVLFLLPALLQWLILRRYVRQAWLWMLAGVVSAMVFNISSVNQDFATWQGMLSATGLQGAITGLSLLWMMRATRYKPLGAGAQATSFATKHARLKDGAVDTGVDSAAQANHTDDMSHKF